MAISARMALAGALVWAAGIGLAQEGVRPMPRPDSLQPAAAAPAETPAATPAAAPAAAETPAPSLAAPAGPAPATTATATRPQVVRDPNRGSVTNLPLPRFVSLKGNEGNARRGPGLTHRIDWVFTRSGMPLKITAEYEHWRRVEDAEGVGGWVHYALLSGVRSVLVAEDLAEFHARPQDESEVLFKAERNVVGWVQECRSDWCRISVDGDRGWVHVSALWGVQPGEIIE
ncbi:SH3 domain-containing protein [Tabrizicola sp. TH137]|uniref:SH3 domain-containing protein n=1 Tax=Tabrizicola sp. TH137 TaxID=2067452 RepID=UPI0020B453E1|nr:SH3 domain-containing protein [Tabrizicola sp. TH137]